MNCISCRVQPKSLPRHRCHYCQLRKDGTDAEAGAAMKRRENPEPSDYPTTFSTGPVIRDARYCNDCSNWVPESYMKTKKRCRGCQIIKDREYRDAKQYGLAPGQRQAWYKAQNGACWGCGNKQKVTGLAVHHDHTTGEAYYLACITCNNGVMGPAFDSPRTLLRLALGMLFPPHKDDNAARIEKILEEFNVEK